MLKDIPHMFAEEFLLDPSPIIALPCHSSVSSSLRHLVEIWSNSIFIRCSMDFSKLLDGFVKIDDPDNVQVS